MKKIDVHNHAGWQNYTLPQVIADMDAGEIQQTWLLNCDLWDEKGNKYLNHLPEDWSIRTDNSGIPLSAGLEFIEQYPERFIPGYAPDPRRSDACRLLRLAHERYGIKVCGELKSRIRYDNPDCIRLCRTAGELQLPVVLHLQYDFQHTDHDSWCDWRGGSIEALENLLIACPDTIIIGHATGFWMHISGDNLYRTYDYPPPGASIEPGGKVLELLDQYPNLYCDISAGSGRRALERDLDFTRKFLNEYQDRILYGRDGYDHKLEALLESLGLANIVLEKIYYDNAKKLLNY